jgi:hypothetical protein
VVDVDVRPEADDAGFLTLVKLIGTFNSETGQSECWTWGVASSHASRGLTLNWPKLANC